MQVPRHDFPARRLRVEPEPLGVAALQRFVTALGNLPQDGVHFRAVLPGSTEQLLQAPFGCRLEQERLGCPSAIPGLRDHQLLQKMGRSAKLGPAGLPGRLSNSVDLDAGCKWLSKLSAATALLPTPLGPNTRTRRGLHRNISGVPQCPTHPHPTYIQHRGQVPGPTGKFLQLHVPLLERGDLFLFLGERHVQLQEETQTLRGRPPWSVSSVYSA